MPRHRLRRVAPPMSGRIREEDIAEVREKARIDDIVSGYVTLRNAGGGSMKGLCPFHDEKSPSFHVTPARGFYHCLAGETRVLTYEGARSIADLAGSTHKVLNARGDWVEAPFKSYGVQPLLKITLTRNRQVKELFATDEHRWFVRAGKDSKRRREVLTKDLKGGDRLVPLYPRSRHLQDDALAVRHRPRLHLRRRHQERHGQHGQAVSSQGPGDAEVVPQQRHHGERRQSPRPPPAPLLQGAARPAGVGLIPLRVVGGILRRRRVRGERRDGDPQLCRARGPRVRPRLSARDSASGPTASRPSCERAFPGGTRPSFTASTSSTRT